MADAILPNATPPAARGSTLRFILRALQYRNYRLFFTGQIVSLVGSWLTIAATSWLVYRLSSTADPTAAPLVLGVVNFAGQLPLFLLAPFAGVWVDRANQHKVLVVTQTLSMLQSFTLAFLALRGVITIGHVIALSAFQGLVNAVDVPTRQAFVVKMVDNREDLSNAIALNSSMVHGSRVVGPAVAGVLIYYFGEGWCFLIDGISYLAVLLALLRMNVMPTDREIEHASPLRALKEGFRYAFGFPPIRALLLLAAASSLMIASQSVLMPIFADQILGFHPAAKTAAGAAVATAGPAGPGNSRVYGLLLCASGLGAFAGSIYLASRRSVIGLGRVIVFALVLLGVMLAAFAGSRSLWLSVPLLLILGGAMVVQFASINTVLQTIVEDRMRGRVMSLYAVCFMGMAPFGSLMAGEVARRVGAPWTLAGCGAACVVSALLFAVQLPALRKHIVPIYQRKGILPPPGVLPEVAQGMQSVAPLSATTVQEGG